MADFGSDIVNFAGDVVAPVATGVITSTAVHGIGKYLLPKIVNRPPLSSGFAPRAVELSAGLVAAFAVNRMVHKATVAEAAAPSTFIVDEKAYKGRLPSPPEVSAALS